MRQKRFWAVGAATLFTLLACTRPAFATYWGNSWNFPQSPGSPILYEYYVDSTGSDPKISNYVGAAANEWTSTSQPADLGSWSSGQITVNVTYQLPNGYDGLTSISGYGERDCPSVCGQNGYTSATITLGQTNSTLKQGQGMDTYPSSDVQRVIAHEFGHSIGLGHNTSCNSIMRHLTYQGAYSPQAYDLYNLNSLYPNSSWSPGSNPCPNN
jgi:hypothetical protein